MTEKKSSGAGVLELTFLFALWYAFSCGYNVFNAFVKAAYPFPYCIAFVQLAVGLPYAIPLWLLGLREVPKLTFSDILTLLPIVLLNAGGHVFAVVAMFTPGGGSFTHVSACFSTLLLIMFVPNNISFYIIEGHKSE